MFIFVDDYTKAISKLKTLEWDSNLSASASCDEVFSKRKYVPNFKYQDQSFPSQRQNKSSDLSDSEALPQIPKPKIRNSEKESSKRDDHIHHDLNLTMKKQNIKRRILQLSESSDNETDSTLVVDNEPQITFTELFKAVNRIEGELFNG